MIWETYWNYMMHRRPAHEFTPTGEVRPYVQGEWWKSGMETGTRKLWRGLEICEYSPNEPTDIAGWKTQYEIMRWRLPFPDVGVYETGYADGYFGWRLCREFRYGEEFDSKWSKQRYGFNYSEQREYLSAYRDGKGDRLAGAVYI